MQQVTGTRAALHLADEGLADRLAPHLQVHQLGLPHPGQGLDELAAIDHDRHWVDLVTVDDGRQPALTAQGLQVLPVLGPWVQGQRDGGAGFCLGLGHRSPFQSN